MNELALVDALALVLDPEPAARRIDGIVGLLLREDLLR